MEIAVLQIIGKLFDMKIFIMKNFHLNKKLITVLTTAMILVYSMATINYG